MTGDHLSANYVANYIRPGPSSNRTRGPIALPGTAAMRYFVEGNVVEGRDPLMKDNSGLFDRREVGGWTSAVGRSTAERINSRAGETDDEASDGVSRGDDEP
jgi:hypothetical protein